MAETCVLPVPQWMGAAQQPLPDVPMLGAWMEEVTGPYYTFTGKGSPRTPCR